MPHDLRKASNPILYTSWAPYFWCPRNPLAKCRSGGTHASRSPEAREPLVPSSEPSQSDEGLARRSGAKRVHRDRCQQCTRIAAHRLTGQIVLGPNRAARGNCEPSETKSAGQQAAAGMPPPPSGSRGERRSWLRAPAHSSGVQASPPVRALEKWACSWKSKRGQTGPARAPSSVSLHF